MKTLSQEARIENVYRLEGRVPISKAIPFGLQHVLAMFVANVAPLIIISSVAVYQGEAFTAIETARLLQNCMLIAGIGTLLQLYLIWKIGSGLPVIMGILAACRAIPATMREWKVKEKKPGPHLISGAGLVFCAKGSPSDRTEENAVASFIPVRGGSTCQAVAAMIQ